MIFNGKRSPPEQEAPALSWRKFRLYRYSRIWKIRTQDCSK